MPHKDLHPLALFSLLPLNERATEVVNNPENIHLVSKFTTPGPGGNRCGLEIGPYIASKSRYTLATIGRCGDIIVAGAGISRIQCSFEIHEGNKEIMLLDRSTNKSTQFFGEAAIPFEPGRTHRRVVVHKNVNLEFGFGGVACDLYRFRIFWHDRSELMDNLHIEHREDNPRQTRTVLDEPPTIAPTHPITRVHTPGNVEKIRYSKRDKLGHGAFGEVWKVANVDSGDYLAVKSVKRPDPQSYGYESLKREVETLARISHRNIIEYRAAQWRGEYLDIIMDFKPGNVESLIRTDLFIREPASANPLLHHMLQALDYLASESIIHRDVKPENILYQPMPGGYLYQLADFGLANTIANAQTFAGSRIYMAPELDNSPQSPSPQTPKMDIWSLFVTLTYAMNVAGFRQKDLRTTSLRIKAIQEAANEEIFRPLRGMAIPDPNQRATAADMLDKLFGGEGRTTTRHKRIRAAATCSDQPGPAPSEQNVEQETVATAEKRFGKRVKRVEERAPKMAASARTARKGGRTGTHCLTAASCLDDQ